MCCTISFKLQSPNITVDLFSEYSSLHFFINLEIGHQKSRENNLEISGLPNSIDEASLENTCIEILGKVGVNVTEHDTEGFHGLPVRKGNPGKPVIIKFVNRKSTEKAIENARNLKNMDLFGVDDYNKNTKIFLGINLTPYFKSLDYHCRQLKKASKISKCFPSSKGFIKIKLGYRTSMVTHFNDLVATFPGFFLGIK